MAAAAESEAVSKAAIAAALEEQAGVLFAGVCIVHRVTYCGRDIIAPNSKITPETADDRGYVPVER